MKEEFVTLYGKATIERDTIYLRSPYLPFEKTIFAQIGIEIIWILSFVLQLITTDTPMQTFVTIVLGFLVFTRFPGMYDKCFKRSYASCIPLSAIQNITIQDDLHGIQTEAKLHLKNGRYKKITFRKLEGQLEKFFVSLSSYNFFLKPA